MKKIEFSQEQIKLILSLYQEENQSQKRISELFKVTRPVIKRVLLENNQMLRKKTQKYYADYKKFEVIDSSEKAYWLGFLAADGCNYQREENASIILNIASKDKEHLEKFKKFMNTNAKIIDYIASAGYSNNTEMSKITLNSVELSKDLSKLGIVPRKSLILKPPCIDKKFYLPYILGYFDGDGSIFKTKQYNNYGINLEGTKELLDWINSLLNISNKLEKRREDDTNNYYIRCGGTKKPYQILKKLYDSCEIHLDRKYQIFKELETVVFKGNLRNNK